METIKIKNNTQCPSNSSHMFTGRIKEKSRHRTRGNDRRTSIINTNKRLLRYDTRMIPHSQHAQFYNIQDIETISSPAFQF